MNDLLRRARPWLQFAEAVLVVAVLYLAQAVLVPVALAILLTFLLTPAVAVLQRTLGRVTSVVIVVALAFSVLGAVGWGVATQLSSLADELPAYRENIREKIADIRGAGQRGSLQKVQEAVKDIQQEITKSAEPSRPPAGAPVTVVQADRATDLWGFPTALGPVVDGLATAGLVIILVVFMLLERADLRNRFIRMAGFRRLTVTTKAFDEAGSRISRYLLRQTIINGTLGLGVGVGLFFIGVPHALVWGFLAAVLRFIPYVGVWIAALPPVVLSLAMFPGWARPLFVIALVIVIELVTSMLLEPLLYAGAAGVSEVGLLVAIAFWTWLWGALGLLMATPLTVCLVVVAKYVPGMRFLITLLGDEPALTPDVAYYQRLLAGDRDEAVEILETYLAGTPAAESVYDAVVLPALNYTRNDRASGQLSPEEEEEIVRATAEVVDDILTGRTRASEEAGGRAPASEPLTVLGCPACGQSDELALRMLWELLDPAVFALDIVSTRLLSSETVTLVRERGCVAVCVGALPPGGLNHARYLVKRLRATCPELKILVGRWGPSGMGGDGADALLAAGADAVAATLTETRDQLYQLAPLLVRPAAERVPGAA